MQLKLTCDALVGTAGDVATSSASYLPSLPSSLAPARQQESASVDGWNSPDEDGAWPEDADETAARQRLSHATGPAAAQVLPA